MDQSDTSSNGKPFWLSESFDVTKASKWDLRRWMAQYDVPLPAADVKLADLRRLFLDHVYANRRSLLTKYHAPVLPVSASPIPQVTPDRVSSVKVDVRNNPAAASAVASGMFSGSSIASTSGAAAAAAAGTATERAERKRKDQQSIAFQTKSQVQETQALSSGEAPSPFPAPVFNRSNNLYSSSSSASNPLSSTSSSRRTVKPSTQQQQQQQQQQDSFPASASSSSYHGHTAAQSSAPAPSFRPAPPRNPFEPTSNQVFSRRTVRPTQPALVTSSATNLTHDDTSTITPTRPTAVSSSGDSPPSPPAPPIWTPQLGAITTAQALSSSSAPTSFRPSTLTAHVPIRPLPPSAPSLIRFPATARPPAPKLKKKSFQRSRTDTFCSRLGWILVSLLLACAAGWVYLRATMPYCPSPASSRSRSLLPPPSASHWRTYLAGIPCHPCPAHARCTPAGELAGCKDPESLVRTLGWSLAGGGRKVACVPDDQLRANVDAVVQAVVAQLRAIAGRAACVAESGDGREGGATGWVTRKEVREQWIPHALRGVAAGHTQQRTLYAERALAAVFSDPEVGGDVERQWVRDDMYGLEDDADRVRALRPVFPLLCRVRRVVRAAVREYWPQAVGLAGVLAWALVWRAQYLRNLYLRETAAGVSADVMDLLTRQQQQANGSVAGVLGMLAVHSKYKRELVEKKASVTAGEWGKVWEMVEVELEQDPNVRRVCTKHRGEVIEGWEWVGFEALAAASPAKVMGAGNKGE